MAGEEFEQSGLAAAVGADEADAVAIGNGQREVVKEQTGAKRLAESGDAEEDGHSVQIRWAAGCKVSSSRAISRRIWSRGSRTRWPWPGRTHSNEYGSRRATDSTCCRQECQQTSREAW